MSQQGMNHLTLTVSDLDRSLAFYVDVLGFKGEVRWEKGAYLSYQNLWLCLSLGKPKPSQDYSHIAFTFSSEEMKKVTSYPVFEQVVLWQKNNSEGDSIYLLDPDGHKLELHDGSLESRLAALKTAPYEGLIWL